MNCQEAKKWMQKSSEANASPEFDVHLAKCNRCALLHSLIQTKKGDFSLEIPELEPSFGLTLAKQIMSKTSVSEKRYKVFSLRWISVAAAAIVLGIIIGKVLINDTPVSSPENQTTVVASNSDNEGYNGYIPSETAYVEYFNVNEK